MQLQHHMRNLERFEAILSRRLAGRLLTEGGECVAQHSGGFRTVRRPHVRMRRSPYFNQVFDVSSWLHISPSPPPPFAASPAISSTCFFMTEAAAIPQSPIPVPHSGRPEPMSNEAALNTTESARAAVTPVPVPSSDIRSDIQSKEPQPGQVESKHFDDNRLMDDLMLLLCGLPPVSIRRAFKSERRKSLGITPYRIIMTTVAGLGIPTAVLSFRGGSALASFIITVGVMLCGLMLFWAKEYRDEDKKWAPWLFERDLSGILLLVWAFTQIVFSVTLMIITSLQVLNILSSRVFGDFKITVALALATSLQFVAAGLMVLTIKSDRSRIWLEKMHFVPRMLLEEVMLMTPKVIYILIVIGLARLGGTSFDDFMYDWRRELTERFEVATSRAILLAGPVVGVVVGVVVGGVSAVCIAGLLSLLDWTLKELRLRWRI